MKHWLLYASIGVIVAGLGLVAAAKIADERQLSKDKSVGLYQLRPALDQFFLENPTIDEARFEDIYGPSLYIKGVFSVDGEDYRKVFPVPRGFRELAVTMGDGRRVILFDGRRLRQEPGGSFSRMKNKADLLEEYETWVAAGRPLER